LGGLASTIVGLSGPPQLMSSKNEWSDTVPPLRPYAFMAWLRSKRRVDLYVYRYVHCVALVAGDVMVARATEVRKPCRRLPEAVVSPARAGPRSNTARVEYPNLPEKILISLAPVAS